MQGRRGHHRTSFLQNITALSEARKEAAPTVSVDAALEDWEFFRQSKVAKCLDGIKAINLCRDNAGREVTTNVARFLSEALLGPNNLTVRLGRLVGRVSRQPIALPILSDAVLANTDILSPSATVEFVDDLTEAERDAIVRHAVSNIQQRLQLQQLELNPWPLREEIVERYEDDIYVTRDAETGQVVECVQRGPKESLIIYRSSEDVHLCLTSQLSHKCDMPTTSPPLEKTRRSIQTYVITEFNLIQWRLQLTETKSQEGDEISYGKVDLGFSDEFWRVLQSIDRSENELDDIIKTLSGLLIGNAKIIAGFDSGMNIQKAPEQQAKSKYFYPNLFGDIVAETRRHYNLKKVGVAAQSVIEIVRKTNNQAKRLLIDEFIATGSAVLDLACGHGQDLLKYNKKDLKVYIGVDVSSAEIREARTRYHKHSSRSQVLAPCRFHVGNMLIPESYSKFLTHHKELDAVSVQLAIHYTLQDEASADMIMASIAKRLKPGGIFIGSCPDSFAIHRRIKENLKRNVDASGMTYTFSNEVYTVSFDADSFHDLTGYDDPETEGKTLEELEHLPIKLPGDPAIPRHPWLEEFLSLRLERAPMGYGEKDREMHHWIEDDPLLLMLSERWGIKYSFWLVDHIDAAEFVVPWRAFCRLARKHGLNCVFACPFDQYCQLMLKKNNTDAMDFERKIAPIIEQSPTAQQQQEVVGFYKVFAFQKMLTAECTTDSAMDMALTPPALSHIARSELRTFASPPSSEFVPPPVAAQAPPQQPAPFVPQPVMAQFAPPDFMTNEISPWDIEGSMYGGSFAPYDFQAGGSFTPAAGSFTPANTPQRPS